MIHDRNDQFNKRASLYRVVRIMLKRPLANRKMVIKAMLTLIELMRRISTAN